MSKMDNLRAMREARFERSSRQPVKRPTAPVAPPVVATPTTPEQETDAGLCGHRAISGRTCTRERGHAAKSHRYG